jgi:hypothetical protein
MAIRVTIIKEPLYGKVVWTGQDFVYTPNLGFAGKDYYVYTMTDGVSSKTDINYVDTVNTAPVASNISLTADATTDVVINIDDYTQDVDGLTAPLKLVRLTPTNFGSATYQNNIITYKSRGFNAIESFDYTVTDGQYYVTAKINLTTINGAETVIPEYVLNSVAASQENSTQVSQNSSIWDQTYTLVSAKSANWNSINNSRYDGNSTLVENSSANWNSIALAKPSYDDASTVVQSKSANWDGVRDKITTLLSVFSDNSANWDQASYDLQTLSATWDTNTTNVNNLSSDYYGVKPTWTALVSLVNSLSSSWDKTSLTNVVSPNSAKWNDTFTILSSNSAKWNGSVDDIALLKSVFDSNFQKWNSTYSTVQSNSAVNWNAGNIRTYVQSNSAGWDNSYTVLTSSSAAWNNNYVLINYLNTVYATKSGNWDSAYTTVNSKSANWDSLYTNVTDNSAKWLYGDANINFVANNLTAFGDVVIAGSLSAAGGITETSTSIVSTSAFDVVNIGTTTALNVTKTQTEGALATFNIGGSPVLFVSPSGRVGINTNSPNVALTVVGDISASGMIYGTVPPEYTVFKSNSAKYEASNTYFSTLCGLLTSKPTYDATSSYVQGVSSNLNNFLDLSSSKYKDAYNVVVAQSANNAASFTSLQSVSSKFGTDTVYRTVSGNYETAYSYITATSGAWLTNNPKFTSLSAGSLSAGNVYLTNAVLTSFTTPITATENFLSISVNGQNRLIQLWQ